MDENQTVWRYMSFSRALWMLQRHRLWMSRADKLDDPWELQLTQQEVDFLVSRHPVPSLGEPATETALGRTKRITDLWRTTTFINCWCANQHESHALWRVFCGPKEGIAIRTSWGKLCTFADFNNFILSPVDYSGYDSKLRTPQLEKVSIRKRHMFEYEHEVRLIAYDETPNAHITRGEFGYQVTFDPVDLIDAIVVHPEADDSFYEVVEKAVHTYSRTIEDRLCWSAMREPPPVILPD